MAGIIKPMGPDVILNGVSNKSTVDNARFVYISNKNANAEITIETTQYGDTVIHMHADHDLIVEKKKTEFIYSNSNNTHFTKIGPPRG